MEVLVSIKVSVDDQREADLLAEAVFSGYAEQVLKVGILYGGFRAVPTGMAQPLSSDSVRAKEAERNIQLTPQQRGDLTPKVVAKEPEPRKAGLAGIKKLRRERG